MAKAEGIATNPLATARQLWRLNKDGRLALVEKTDPLTAVYGDAAIKGELLEHGPHGETWLSDLDGVGSARAEHSQA